MGCDVHGFVEVDRANNESEREHWASAICLEGIVSRSYDSFGSLFGVRGRGGFDPVVPRNRGFPSPPDNQPHSLSPVARREYAHKEVDAYSESYVTLQELSEVDWTEESARLEQKYSVITASGETVYSAEHLPVLSTLSESELEKLEYGERVVVDDFSGEERYLVRKPVTRRGVLSDDWEWLLFDLMTTFGEKYGGEGTRLVVWFEG